METASGQNVSNNFVKIFNELYLFSMDFALNVYNQKNHLHKRNRISTVKIHAKM